MSGGRTRAGKRGIADVCAPLLAAAAAAGTLGCTWVPLTPGGESVRVVSPESASACEQLGHTRSRTTTRVGIFARRDTAVREEQVSLARNEAARLGGNAIAPLGPPEAGEQAFGVYLCPEP